MTVSKSLFRRLVAQYSAVLEGYVAEPKEGTRQRAYELAADALGRGLGVLDVAAAHNEALLKLLRDETAPEAKERVAQLAAEVLLESLAPFEMTHRGYQETIRQVADKEATIQAEQKAAAEREKLLRQVEDFAAVAQQRAAELQGILENMVDAVFVCDRSGRITLANEAGLRLFGLTSAQALRPLAELPLRLRHPGGDLYKPEEQPLIRALAGEVVAQEEEVFLHPISQRDVYVRTSAAPMRDKRGAIIGAVAVSRDVTEVTELDRLKDQFISVAAHELKTPVSITKGYAQALLRAGTDLSAPSRRMLQAIDRGSDRIDAIVKDLLDISRLQSGQLALASDPVDLRALAREVADRMGLVSSKHQIKLVRADPVVVHGDRNRLEQVFNNLIENAIKYSPNGGRIEISVSVNAGDALVCVRDYGVGIPSERQDRIFQRFYSAHSRTPADYGGMGVGLYISKEIVERHGGRMCFESPPEGPQPPGETGPAQSQGTAFYFSLPIR